MEKETEQKTESGETRNSQRGFVNRNAQGGAGANFFLGDEAGNSQQVISHLMEMNQRLMLHTERVGLLLELFSRNYVELIEREKSAVARGGKP